MSLIIKSILITIGLLLWLVSVIYLVHDTIEAQATTLTAEVKQSEMRTCIEDVCGYKFNK